MIPDCFIEITPDPRQSAERVSNHPLRTCKGDFVRITARLLEPLLCRFVVALHGGDTRQLRHDRRHLPPQPHRPGVLQCRPEGFRRRSVLPAGSLRRPQGVPAVALSPAVTEPGEARHGILGQTCRFGHVVGHRRASGLQKTDQGHPPLVPGGGTQLSGLLGQPSGLGAVETPSGNHRQRMSFTRRVPRRPVCIAGLLESSARQFRSRIAETQEEQTIAAGSRISLGARCRQQCIEPAAGFAGTSPQIPEPAEPAGEAQRPLRIVFHPPRQDTANRVVVSVYLVQPGELIGAAQVLVG